MKIQGDVAIFNGREQASINRWQAWLDNSIGAAPIYPDPEFSPPLLVYEAYDNPPEIKTDKEQSDDNNWVSPIPTEMLANLGSGLIRYADVLDIELADQWFNYGGKSISTFMKAWHAKGARKLGDKCIKNSNASLEKELAEL